MLRISVVGNTGSGKSTVARRLGERLGCSVLELDAVYHQSGWRPLDAGAFRERMDRFTAGDRWVVDGNYASHGVADIVWPRADTIVWLDLPRRLVMRRVIARTLRRMITRAELWNGNREPWTNLYSRDPEENIVLWSWTRHALLRAAYEAAIRDGTWAHLRVHRLRTAVEVDAFVAG